MSLNVTQITRHEGYWLLDLEVKEGVYHKDHYPVRVVDVPLAPAGWDIRQQEEQMRRFVLDRVHEHMRSGALPPRGTQLNGEEAWTWKPESVARG